MYACRPSASEKAKNTSTLNAATFCLETGRRIAAARRPGFPLPLYRAVEIALGNFGVLLCRNAPKIPCARGVIKTRGHGIAWRNNRVVEKLQFLNNFPQKILEFAANCGKIRGTCERTGRFLNKSNEESSPLVLPVPLQ
jgi:hypothetical protein